MFRLKLIFTFLVACLSLVLVPTSFAGTMTQTVSLHNKAGVKNAPELVSFQLPGIGRADITCQPRRTWIIMYPDNRLRETDMWTSKYELKDGKWSASVKNARVYRYAHVDDVSGGGTGPTSREGFNQQWPIEKASRGYMYGLISQKAPRNQTGAQTMPPATSFYLTWSWKNFGTDRAECHVTATVKTAVNVSKPRTIDNRTWVRWDTSRFRVGRLIHLSLRDARSIDLTWRFGGQDQALTKQVEVAGLGTFTVNCDPATRAMTVSLLPTTANSGMYITSVQGEGFEAEDIWQETFDPQTGLVGPVRLPQNGMVRIGLQVGATQTTINLSSLAKFNDPSGRKNFCEIAMQVI